MSKRSVMTALTLGCLLTGVRCGWAQSPGGFSLGTDLGNLGSLGLNPGMVGGGEVMPGAVLVKLRGEVQCVDCTLEEMGIE
ncbi:MAG: hypothetical protein HYZ72_02700, partial [Deltaproteobacteria bacterium]|nr:hypothetical protein [Deltaproteobacteria bacterium]